jgi:phage FluMu protein Com
MITYKCNGCGSVLGSSEALAGRMEVCPKCQTANLIPSGSTAPRLQEAGRSGLAGLAGKIAFGAVSAALVCCLGYLLLSRSSGGEDQPTKNELAALQATTASLQAEREDLKRKVAALTASGEHLKRENETLRADYRALATSHATAEHAEKPVRVAAVPPAPVVTPETATPATADPAPAVVKEAAAPPPAPATPVVSAEAAKAPLAKPMPKEDQEKLRRMIAWLQRNIACISCGGKGLISGSVCGDCAAKVTVTTTSKRQEPTGYRVWNPVTRTYSPEMVWREYEENHEKGNGKTPIEKLRPTMSLIVGLYQQYYETIPADLKALAKGVCLQIDKTMVTDFAAPEAAPAPAPAPTSAPAPAPASAS